MSYKLASWQWPVTLVVSDPGCVLGTKLRSTVRAASTFNTAQFL